MRTVVLTLVLLVLATATILAAPIVERQYSNFDTANDGWISTPRIVGGIETGAASQVQYSKTAPTSWRDCAYGHNEGLGGELLDPSTTSGYLMVKDAWTQSGPMGVVAPSTYGTTLTDWAADSATTSLTLSFDALEMDTTNTSTTDGFGYWEAQGKDTHSPIMGTLVIEGAGHRASLDLAPFNPIWGTSVQAIDDNWTRYNVDLIGSGGLNLKGWSGDLPGALGDVDRIQVLLESRSSYLNPLTGGKLWETDGFDNFVIARGSGRPNVPELPTAALALLGLVPVALLKLRRRAK